MTKKKRKILLASLMTAFVIVSGGLLWKQTEAKAETFSQRTGFYVENGASVRLKSEHKNFGIRFKAKVGEKVDGAVYNMLIAPIELVNVYENDFSEGKGDIITYLKKYASDRGGSLSIVKNCEVDGNGVMHGAIVNILWKNINRKFVGIAYYEKDGQITVAQRADDGERSIVDVSQKALDSNDYTLQSDLKILLEKIRYGAMAANGATEADKQSNAYQYESFYGASISDGKVITAAGSNVSLRGLSGSVASNALKLSTASDGSVTFDFGMLPQGTYRFRFSQTLQNGSFTSEITQNGDTVLANTWQLNELGNDFYELYFRQDSLSNVSLTLSTTTAGAITIDDIALEPAAVSALEYNREAYMFGIGGLVAGINASEGTYCDPKTSSEWVALASNELGVESQRVWMSVPQIVKRADNSNELHIDKELATSFHNHFKRLRSAGVKRILVMLSRFIYPYDYTHCSDNCAPDPEKEPSVYKQWVTLQYEAYKSLAKEFPEITFWECGNEQDLDTYLYKNGLKDKSSWSWGQSTRDYTFTNTQKAYITADLCYAASKAFKLYNPENMVVMPGMSAFATKADGHPYATKKTYYFEDLYEHIESGKLPTMETNKVTDSDRYFDIIAWHCYAESVGDFEAFNDVLLATAQKHGDGDKRVWITELGFTENNFGGKGTESAQNAIADLTKQTLESLAQEKYASTIETVFFFRLSDAPALGDGGESCFGIYNSPSATTNANKAKPIAKALYEYFNKTSTSVDELTFWKGDLREENFDNAAWKDTNLLHTGADINFFNAEGELVDCNGNQALKVTKTAQEYAYVMFSVGHVEKGTYLLTLDVIEQSGFNAIVQFRSLSNEMIQENINNYKTLFELAKKDGNTYALRIGVKNDCEEFGILLASSSKTTVGESMVIDNVRFEKISVLQTIDFEDGVVQRVAGVGDTSANVFAGYATSNLTTDNKGVINLPNEIVTEENGNKYYTVNYKGWSSWSAFNFGFFRAGTYTVTMRVKQVKGTPNGNFIMRINNQNVALTKDVDYTVDGEIYVFRIVLTTDCMHFGIGYQCKNENADFTLGYDDIKVAIGTNSDGNVGDNYNWIDMFYQNQKEKIKINKGKEKDYV